MSGLKRVVSATFIGVFPLLISLPVRALAQQSPPNNFIRTHFTVEDGLPGNVVDEICQTTDGFLWVITNGVNLIRFDGRVFYEFAQHPGTMAAASGGGLWIGTPDALFQASGRDLSQFSFPGLTTYHPGSGKDSDVSRLRMGRDGGLWVGTKGGLFRYDGTGFTAVGPRVAVREIEETPERHLLLVTQIGFVELEPAPTNRAHGDYAVVPHPGLAERLGVTDMDILHVLKDRRGTTWYSTKLGLVRATEGRVEPLGAFGPGQHAAFRTYEDVDGTIWISKDEGLFRATADRLEPIAPGLQVRSLFTDRDGNLWVGTNGDGLYRLKPAAVRMFTRRDGLPNDVLQTVMAASDGTLWAGANCGGLTRFDGTHFETYNERNGLLNSCVWAIAEDRDRNLWVGTWGGGAFRFHGGTFTQVSKKDGLPDDRVTTIVAARDGTIWLGTRDGISRLSGGRIRNVYAADGHALGAYRLVEDRSGTLWVGTRQGLYRLVNDHFELFPLDSKQVIIPIGDDADRGFLVSDYHKDAVRRIDADHVDAIAGLPIANDMVETLRDQWFAGLAITRVARGALARPRATDDPLDYETFSIADGLATSEVNTTPGHNLALTPDGRLWAATTKGLAMFDLGRLPLVTTKPFVYLTNVTIGRQTVRPAGDIVLPAGTNHLQIDFGAIEVSSPEKIRLQYRLDDVDSEWLDAGRDPRAIYSTLPPGRHLLHIRATNRSGIWDRQGVVFGITQVPFLYQTRWFVAAMWIAGALLVVGVYQLRVRQVSRAMSARFDERLAERTRVAREIHDTLMQTVQGSKLVADHALKDPGDHARMRRAMEQITTWLAQATTEGRAALNSLRSSTTQTNDLAEALRRAAEESRDASHAEVTLTTKGDAREMHPVVRDEIYRVGYEAIRNACQHSGADRVDVSLEYGHDLTLSVRDNGVGLDAEVAERGKEGHFGLPGMRERAARIGGRLTVISAPGAGTVITLIVPGRLAFRRAGAAWLDRSRFIFWRH